MSLLDALCLAAAVLASALAGVRFLRVAQREHYLPGSTTRFALRWWRARPSSAGLLVIALAGAATTWLAGWPGLVTAAAVALGPLGLSLRGRTSALVWTRRLGSVAAASGALFALATVLAGALGGLRIAATVAVIATVLVPVVIDGSLVVLAPIEERLAAAYVERARAMLARVRPTVVAITGSYGKTSTKGYLAHLLSGRFAVLASPKSFNNRAGLSRTVNELLAPGTEVLVAEMGTYGRGEIAALCAWMQPKVAVLTAIGPVHLERFKSLDVTLEAKAEITEGAEVVVCNVDDERLAGLADRLAAQGRRVVRASGGEPHGGAEVVVRAGAEELILLVGGAEVGRVALAAGRERPVASNVACAVGAALALEVAPGEALSRLGELPGAESRLSARRGESGVVILDDTFNSNPAGARLALGELTRLGAVAGRRVVVTPGMVELGPLQAEENERFAAAASAVATDVVVVSRTNRRALLAGARAAGGATCTVVGRREDAVAWVREHLGDGDVVLYENDLPDHYP